MTSSEIPGLHYSAVPNVRECLQRLHKTVQRGLCHARAAPILYPIFQYSTIPIFHWTSIIKLYPPGVRFKPGPLDTDSLLMLDLGYPKAIRQFADGFQIIQVCE
jgi:hypothetical protein